MGGGLRSGICCSLARRESYMTPLITELSYHPDSATLFSRIAQRPWAIFLDGGLSSGKEGPQPGRYDIMVNAVAPGFMSTPMSVINGIDETTTPEFIEWYCDKGKIPLRRAGQPEDVAGTVIFLASPYCRYMTGQLLVVDGGLMSTF